jgi:phage FluMu protein Com
MECLYCRFIGADSDFEYVANIRQCPSCREAWRQTGKTVTEITLLKRKCNNCDVYLVQMFGGSKKEFHGIAINGVPLRTIGHIPYVVVFCPQCKTLYDGEEKQRDPDEDY